MGAMRDGRRSCLALVAAVVICALCVRPVWACAQGADPVVADGPVDVHALVEAVPPEYRHILIQRLSVADEHKVELVRALRLAGEGKDAQAAADEREAMAFLIVNMPESDLKALDSSFLLRTVSLAFEARRSRPWAAAVPKEIFLDAVLPYANVSEARDDWRVDFASRFAPVVKECTSAREAAQRLNREIFAMVKVSYHATKREKPDQSPKESMDIGYASCTGLSIILVDACRAVGVPARVVGTPLWADKSGNHTWAEIWDGEWMYIAAAEPGEFNKSWFSAMASKAEESKPEHRIYAASFLRTDGHFVMPWAEGRTDVGAVDVSADYIGKRTLRVRWSAMAEAGIAHATFSVRRDGRLIAQRGGSEAEFSLGVGRGGVEYTVEANVDGKSSVRTVQLMPEADTTIELRPGETSEIGVGSGATGSVEGAAAGLMAVRDLQTWLARRRAERGAIDGQLFATARLEKEEAATAARLLWEDHAAMVRAERAAEWEGKRLTLGEGDGKKEMPFLSKEFGKKPAAGWDLYISMHGGGNAPAEVNDQQWQNQIKLYSPENSLVIAPRAPTNTWNLWHEAHIDVLFDRLIEDAIVLGDVNPDRVYLMGYSAGGDGVYQLAPRMADRFAAVSMMAGHPNDASPLGLRNIGFALHMGADDDGYGRNKVAREWGVKLDDLRRDDPTGYRHEVELHAGRGHWMNGEDAKALGWMSKFTREACPERVVWKQGGVVHESQYWLAVPRGEGKAGSLVVAKRSGGDHHADVRGGVKEQWIEIEKAEGVRRLIVRLNDRMFDLDAPVVVRMGGKELYRGVPDRTTAVMSRTLAERGDPGMVFSAEVIVEIPEGGD